MSNAYFGISSSLSRRLAWALSQDVPYEYLMIAQMILRAPAYDGYPLDESCNEYSKPLLATFPFYPELTRG